MGFFTIDEHKCSECTYLDLSKREGGKYYCEKEYKYVRAMNLVVVSFVKHIQEIQVK